VPFGNANSKVDWLIPMQGQITYKS